MDDFPIMSKGYSISFFDAVILLLCVASSTATFGDAAAKDLINVAVVLCVHACMLKRSAGALAAVMDELRSQPGGPFAE